MDIHAIFKRWVADIRSDADGRYSYRNRTKHIELLIGYFKQHGVDQDSAQSLKRKVVEILVTPEGMRGKDKHKGWKENTENDFDDAIQMAYVPGVSTLKVEHLKGAHGFDPNVVAWAKNKFGKNVDEEILKACHQPMNVYQLMFINDFFKRNTGGTL